MLACQDATHASECVLLSWKSKPLSHYSSCNTTTSWLIPQETRYLSFLDLTGWTFINSVHWITFVSSDGVIVLILTVTTNCLLHT